LRRTRGERSRRSKRNQISCLLILCAHLSLISMILGASQMAAAATMGRYRMHRAGRATEINFNFRGRAPRWLLSGHGQELWLDLDDATISEPARRSSSEALFPLVSINLREFRGTHVRVVIRVSGKIDYAAAQNDHELAVRIAPSGQYPELTRSLLAEMDQTPQPYSRFRLAAVPPAEPAQNIAEQASARGTPRGAAMHGGDERHLRASYAMVAAPEIPAATLPERPAGASLAAVAPPPGVASLPQTPTQRPLIVIDAGHGGFDPGTESAYGIAEKTLALAIARRVENALQAHDIQTELTRADDSFLGLSGRTQFANHAHAALFVSIHLNSSPDRSTSGIETYYLNNTTDRATIRLARMENGRADTSLGGSNLKYILTNLRQDYKANESAWLARMIEAESTASITAALGLRVNELGAKMGPFYVLVGAEMPSVLVECGFLSNAHEAELLTEPQYQQALADGIANAVVRYFSTDSMVGNL
jgi:N-acetylmuramoyl-L-alanine amidase